MKRDRGCLLPMPVEESHRKTVTGLLSLTETEIDTIYSKLLLARPEDVLSIIQIERMELNAQLNDNEGCPEICFIEQALELLNEREKSTKNCLQKVQECTPKNDTDLDLACEFNSTLSLHHDDTLRRTRQESISSEADTGSECDRPNVDAEDLEISNTSTIKPFYFYQGW